MAAADQQVYFCVRTAYLSGDPNSNGGLDSNGYMQAFIESDYFTQAVSFGPEVRLNLAMYPTLVSDQIYALAGGARVWCYASQVVTGSPTSSDDGFTLLIPIAAYNPLQVQFLYEPSYSASGDLILWQASGAGSGSPNSFATSDNKTFIIPDNGIYLSIVSLTFESSNPFFTCTPVFSQNLGGSPEQFGQATAAAIAGDYSQVTIPMMFAGKQGVGIACQLYALAGAISASYGQWAVTRIGDTGTKGTGLLPLPPTPP